MVTVRSIDWDNPVMRPWGKMLQWRGERGFCQIMLWAQNPPLVSFSFVGERRDTELGWNMGAWMDEGFQDWEASLRKPLTFSLSISGQRQSKVFLSKDGFWGVFIHIWIAASIMKFVAILVTVCQSLAFHYWLIMCTWFLTQTINMLSSSFPFTIKKCHNNPS